MSNRIRALREAQGLTLEALAELSGTTNQQISHLESGRRRLTVDWLCRLGEALSCHPWALVEEDLPSTALPPPETRLLTGFRGLRREQREAVLTIVSALSTSARRRRASE
ncbi:helix-turn-helix domain-containing protein [Lysobacter soli]|uniref:helix-turn-helix domain-containing protein n=1 Tax=Lysobacter soli TaxID=453783 RepID=UPI0012EEA1E9|nr:helix-turn-helix domain-containing protein [Lysobacter soli]